MNPQGKRMGMEAQGSAGFVPCAVAGALLLRRFTAAFESLVCHTHAHTCMLYMVTCSCDHKQVRCTLCIQTHVIYIRACRSPLAHLAACCPAHSHQDDVKGMPTSGAHSCCCSHSTTDCSPLAPAHAWTGCFPLLQAAETPVCAHDPDNPSAVVVARCATNAQLPLSPPSPTPALPSHPLVLAGLSLPQHPPTPPHHAHICTHSIGWDLGAHYPQQHQQQECSGPPCASLPARCNGTSCLRCHGQYRCLAVPGRFVWQHTRDPAVCISTARSTHASACLCATAANLAAIQPDAAGCSPCSRTPPCGLRLSQGRPPLPAAGVHTPLTRCRKPA